MSISTRQGCAALLAASWLGAAVASDGAEHGRQLFVKDATPPCALCHTLKDAGASGAVGPSLDELKPDAARVTNAVKVGFGAMPAYPALSADQVQAIANYVARATGAAK